MTMDLVRRTATSTSGGELDLTVSPQVLAGNKQFNGTVSLQSTLTAGTFTPNFSGKTTWTYGGYGDSVTIGGTTYSTPNLLVMNTSGRSSFVTVVANNFLGPANGDHGFAFLDPWNGNDGTYRCFAVRGGTPDVGSGAANLADYAYINRRGDAFFGGTFIAGTTSFAVTSFHTINGRLKVQNANRSGNATLTSVLGTTGTNFTNGVGTYDYDTGTDDSGGLIVISWSVNGTRGVTVLYKVDNTLTQIATSGTPSNLTFSAVSSGGTANAIRIVSAAGNTGLSVGASVTYIGGI